MSASLFATSLLLIYLTTSTDLVPSDAMHANGGYNDTQLIRDNVRFSTYHCFSAGKNSVYSEVPRGQTSSWIRNAGKFQRAS